jgi:hypothetical protein
MTNEMKKELDDVDKILEDVSIMNNAISISIEEWLEIENKLKPNNDETDE